MGMRVCVRGGTNDAAFTLRGCDDRSWTSAHFEGLEPGPWLLKGNVITTVLRCLDI